MAQVAVLGAGSWGTALAQSLAWKGHKVCLWSRDKDQVEAMQKSRCNKKYLPQVILHDGIELCHDIEAVQTCTYLIFAVPTQQQRNFLKEYKTLLTSMPEAIFVNVAKGLEAGTGDRLSKVYNDELGDVSERFVALYGPSHAEEVGLHMPTALVAASTRVEAAEAVQRLFMCDFMRVYTNDDLTGVELGGALKNIIALAIGMAVGLGYGDNARAALMTRGLAEITRMGVALGANPQTFLGLTGVGDLIVTCTSGHSRNRSAGIRLGQGESMASVQKNMGMVVEGIETCRAANVLSQEEGITMPIVEHMYRVLFEDLDVQDAAILLMTRSKKSELEDYLGE